MLVILSDARVSAANKGESKDPEDARSHDAASRRSLQTACADISLGKSWPRAGYARCGSGETASDEFPESALTAPASWGSFDSLSVAALLRGRSG